MQLTARRKRPALRVDERSLQSVAPKLVELGLDPTLRTYAIRPPAEFGKLVENSSTLAIATTSFLGVMRVMAGGVEVPCEHRRQGLAPEIVLLGLPPRIREVFHVRSSRSRPCARLAVRHRGYWFYIDDSDAQSRTGFYTVALFYDLELGGDSKASQAPVLTLPLG